MSVNFEIDLENLKVMEDNIDCQSKEFKTKRNNVATGETRVYTMTFENEDKTDILTLLKNIHNDITEIKRTISENSERISNLEINVEELKIIEKARKDHIDKMDKLRIEQAYIKNKEIQNTIKCKICDEKKIPYKVTVCGSTSLLTRISKYVYTFKCSNNHHYKSAYSYLSLNSSQTYNRDIFDEKPLCDDIETDDNLF